MYGATAETARPSRREPAATRAPGAHRGPNEGAAVTGDNYSLKFICNIIK